MAKKEKEEKKKKSKKVEEPKKTKVAKGVEKASKPKKVTDEWDEQENSGGDYVTLPSGEYLARVRSVISLGQVIFTFNGKKDTKATSAMGFVLEVWKYKIKKDKIVITSEEPAIVYHVMKAHKNNDKSHYTKMMKAFKCKTPADMQDQACGIELFTSEKGYMYVRGGCKAVGLAERKAVPKLTQKGYLVPNLDKMTVDAMLELNPMTQVKDYVLEAANYPSSAAEKCVAKIRKDKPEFAKLSKEKAEKKAKEDKKAKKGKKPKKLSEDEEY